MSYIPIAQKENSLNRSYIPIAEKETQPRWSIQYPQETNLGLPPIGGMRTTTQQMTPQKDLIPPAIREVKTPLSVSEQNGKLVQKWPTTTISEPGRTSVFPEPSYEYLSFPKVAETLAPALTAFTKTTTGVFGEGLAYLVDPMVREEYKKGNLDILPTLTKTSLGDLTKKTTGAMIEATVFKILPPTLKQTIYARFGIGALQGLGFAISEGLAKDYTPEQVIENAKSYATFGAAINMVVPYLGRILKAKPSELPAIAKEFGAEFTQPIKEIMAETEQRLIRQGFTPAEARLRATQGGFAKLPEKTPSEPQKALPEALPAEESIIPQELQPLAKETIPKNIDKIKENIYHKVFNKVGYSEKESLLKLKGHTEYGDILSDETIDFIKKYSQWDWNLKPNERVIQELSLFKPNKPVILYRGGELFEGKRGFNSWTYDLETAQKFAKDGKIYTAKVNPEDIILDKRYVPDNVGGFVMGGTENEVLVKANIKGQIYAQAVKGVQELAQTLRGTKGLTAGQITQKYPDILLKRDVPATDIYGNKVKIPEGEALTPYELKGNKVLLQDGETYIVSKNQFQNIKGNAVSGEAKEFAPELKGTEEVVLGKREFGVLDRKGIDNAIEEGKKGKEMLNFYGINERGIKTKIHNRADLDNYKKFIVDYFETPTKFSQYQLPGGKNYKEVIHKDLKFPVEPETSHFDDAASWHRSTEQTYKGKKVLFLEEIQKNKNLDKVPGHPLGKGKYVKAEIQSALKEAVDNNSEYLAWTTGEQQAARYNLSTQLESIKWDKPTDLLQKSSKVKSVELKAIGRARGEDMKITVDENGKVVETLRSAPSEWKGKQLGDVIGKGVAEKILAEPKGNLSGEGLNIGGEWAKNLYDKQVKNIVEDITGHKVEVIDMGLPIDAKLGTNWSIGRKEGVNTVWSELKKSQLKVGQEIAQTSTGDNLYIITDILGDGKFKAVPKSDVYDPNYVGTELIKDGTYLPVGNRYYPADASKTFDISTKKSTGQQAIKITPEIKAMVRGEAQKLPSASGKMFGEPTQAVKGGKEVGVGIKPAVKPLDEFDEYLKREFGDITPEQEKAILTTEAMKETGSFIGKKGGQLFQDIKQAGGIKSYRGKLMAGELNQIPLRLRNNKGLPLDELADMLKNRGYNFESDTDLLNTITDIETATKNVGDRRNVNYPIRTLRSLEKFAPDETAKVSRKLLNRLIQKNTAVYREVFPALPPMYKAARRALEKGTITEIPQEIENLIKSPLRKIQNRFTKIFQVQKETNNIRPVAIKGLSEKYKSFLPDDELYRYEERYAQKRLDKFGGYTSKLMEDLKGAGVRDEVINNLQIENQYLKNLVKIKREATGEISAAISDNGLNFIKNTKQFGGEPEWFKKWSVENLKATRNDILRRYETGMRFFERLGKGYKSLIFDPIRQGERLSVERYSWLKDNRLSSVFDLTNKEAEEVWVFSAKKQGKEVEAKLWAELNPKQQKAYIDALRTAEELYPEVKEVALKNGREIGKIKNYTPLYTSDDIIRSGEGGWDWTRKDPYFGSLKERVPEVPIEMYEKNFKKVIDTWMHGVSSYIDIGKRTVPVKYLIESKEFAEITGGEMTKQIQDWYRYLVNPPRVEGIWKGVRAFRSLQAIRILTQPFVVAKQSLNLVDAWSLSSIPQISRGMKTAVGRDAISQIVKTSAVIRERGVDLAVQDLQGTVIQWLRAPTTYNDRLTAKIIFSTFFKNALERAEKNGLELSWKVVKGAKREASDMVESIMGEMSRAGTPPVFRSEAGKAVNMFYSQLNSKVQFYVRDVPMKYRKSMAKAITALVIGTYLEYAISRMSFTDEPFEMAKDVGLNLLGNIPLIGSIAWSLQTGQPYYGSPMLSGLSQFLIAVSKGLNEATLWAGLGLVGVPNEIKNMWQGWQVIQEGGLKTKTGTLKFPVEGTAEQIRTFLKGKYGSLKAKEYFEKLGKPKEKEVKFVSPSEWKKKKENELLSPSKWRRKMIESPAY